MPLSVEITESHDLKRKDTPGGPPKAGLHATWVRCRVADPDYQDGLYDGTFDYFIWKHDGLTVRVELVGVRGGVDPARVGDGGLTVSQVRDLPLSRWEAAARSRVVSEQDPLAASVVAQLAGLPPEQHREVFVTTLLEAVYPGLDEDTTPAGRRRARSLRRMAEVAVDYQRLTSEGVADPAAELAREYGQSRSSVRTAIHRARNAGLLGRPTDGGPQSNLADPATFMSASAARQQLARAVTSALTKTVHGGS